MRCAVLVLVGLVMVPVAGAVDRDKPLSEPGVYGTFAAFQLDGDWARQDQAARIAHQEECRLVGRSIRTSGWR